MRISTLLTIIAPAVVLYVLAARASLGELGSASVLAVVASVALCFGPYFARLVGMQGDRLRLTALSTFLGVAVAAAGSSTGAIVSTHRFAWIAVALVVLERLLRTWRAGRGEDKTDTFVTVLSIIMLTAALIASWSTPLNGAERVSLEAGIAVLLWLGALSWMSPTRDRLRAVALPAAVASIVVFSLGLLLVPRAPVRWQIGLLLASAGPVWLFLFIALRRLGSLRFLRSPRGLVARVAEARISLDRSSTLDEIVRALSAPLQGGGVNGVPELLTLDPPQRLSVDSYDELVSRGLGELESLIREALAFVESPVIDRDSLLRRSVREPELRALADAMTTAELDLIVVCTDQHHPEALLLVSESSIRRPLSRAERQALASLGLALGGMLSQELFRLRADSRIEALTDLHRDAQERVAALEGELTQVRGQVDLLGRGIADNQALHIAYSATMRETQTRAIELAPTEQPVLLVAPAGSAAVPMARFMHDRGPRWQAPFVVADCASAEAALADELVFGSDSSRAKGWLSAAFGGTLVLRDLPTLPAAVQGRLAETLDAQSQVEVRIIATARAPLPALRQSDALIGVLADCFEGSEVLIPPLVERRQDVPSLVWVTIARASRVLSVDPVGIEPEAMDILVQYDWPGDVAELELVMERAVSRARGRAIGPPDLLPLGRTEGDEHPLDGTYAEVERRLLLRTLERASGNKSKAARALGLKRTTFLDKLGRHALDEGSEEALGGARVSP